MRLQIVIHNLHIHWDVPCQVLCGGLRTNQSTAPASPSGPPRTPDSGSKMYSRPDQRAPADNWGHLALWKKSWMKMVFTVWRGEKPSFWGVLSTAITDTQPSPLVGFRLLEARKHQRRTWNLFAKWVKTVLLTPDLLHLVWTVSTKDRIEGPRPSSVTRQTWAGRWKGSHWTSAATHSRRSPRGGSRRADLVPVQPWAEEPASVRIKTDTAANVDSQRARLCMVPSASISFDQPGWCWWGNWDGSLRMETQAFWVWSWAPRPCAGCRGGPDLTMHFIWVTSLTSAETSPSWRLQPCARSSGEEAKVQMGELVWSRLAKGSLC